MRNPVILIILLAAILISCRTKAENLATNLNENSTETRPLVVPTPTASSASKAQSTSDIHSKIGIADVSSDQTGCLRTKNANLAEKTPVSIIILLDEPPQKVL